MNERPETLVARDQWWENINSSATERQPNDRRAADIGFAAGYAKGSVRHNEAIAELFQAARDVCDNRTCDETRELTEAMERLEAALSALGTGDGT